MTMKPVRNSMVKPSTTKMMLPPLPVFRKKINTSRWKSMMKLSLLTSTPDVGSMRSSSAEASFQSSRCAPGNLAPGLGSTSPSSSKGSPSGHKGKKGKGRGGKNHFKSPPRPAGKGEIKARSQAGIGANNCLRCGAYGHRAAECPVNRSPNKRPAPSSASVESVAYDPMETGLVIFQDGSGHERPDSAMLDPGASAYLSGYGPFEICGTSTQPWISS